MGAIKHYTVIQTREVKVSATCAVDAVRIADAAFENGQDADNGVAKGKAPEGLWGNTTSKIEITDISAQQRTF